MIKATVKTLAIFSLILVSFIASAQEISCDAFCITDVRMDTSTPNLMYLTLLFSGDNDDFINYPWIAEVINDQGDTIGVGTWNFFGQFGNTSNDYAVTVEFDTLPDNFNATMVFHYDTSVCLLDFPCSMTGIENLKEKNQLKIYPNPTSGLIHIEKLDERENETLYLRVIDLQGRVIAQTLLNEETIVDLSFISAGAYLLLLNGSSGCQSAVLIKEQ
jgi:hypothetical protein